MTRKGTKPREVSDTRTRLTPMFKCLLHNDDHNSMEHVVDALMATFHFELQKSIEIMAEAHNRGVALCAVLPQEQAEFRRDMLQSWSLTATIEPEA